MSTSFGFLPRLRRTRAARLFAKPPVLRRRAPVRQEVSLSLPGRSRMWLALRRALRRKAEDRRGSEAFALLPRPRG
eukprot:14706117-Alexandrium_andersonii.AAC.1